MTFTQTSFMKGFYNLNEGDIYIFATYTIRGNHEFRIFTILVSTRLSHQVKRQS